MSVLTGPILGRPRFRKKSRAFDIREKPFFDFGESQDQTITSRQFLSKIIPIATSHRFFLTQSQFSNGLHSDRLSQEAVDRSR